MAKCMFVVSVEPCRTIGCEMLLNGTTRPDLPMNVYTEKCTQPYQHLAARKKKRIIPITLKWQVSNNHMDLCTTFTLHWERESYYKRNEMKWKSAIQWYREIELKKKNTTGINLIFYWRWIAIGWNIGAEWHKKKQIQLMAKNEIKHEIK